jgi:sugar phosphate isomerase/epimerase
MRQDQISLQLYTVREETARDMPATLRRISEIGYPAVEFAGFRSLSAEDLSNILDDIGLRASGAHVPFDSWQKDPESVITDMHTLDCAHAILPMAPPERHGDESAVATLAGSLNRWGELCRQEGVTFSYHNHDFEFAPLGGTTMWEVLVRETDPELVYFELDLYWVRYSGADPEPLLSDLGDRIPLVHLKDMASGGQRSDLPVGEGTMPWNRLLEAADASGVQWYVAEQDNPRDALEDVRISLQSMRELASL